MAIAEQTIVFFQIATETISSAMREAGQQTQPTPPTQST